MASPRLRNATLFLTIMIRTQECKAKAWHFSYTDEKNLFGLADGDGGD
jgi:hypothetical protein